MVQGVSDTEWVVWNKTETLSLVLCGVREREPSQSPGSHSSLSLSQSFSGLRHLKAGATSSPVAPQGPAQFLGHGKQSRFVEIMNTCVP